MPWSGREIEAVGERVSVRMTATVHSEDYWHYKRKKVKPTAKTMSSATFAQTWRAYDL